MSARRRERNEGHLCWYCPLFCDRSVVTDPCQLRDRSEHQARTRSSVSPRIGEESVSWETAIQFASQAISRSRFACLTGAIGDIVAAGEALDLGRWLNAAIDLFDSDASFACFDVMQRRGAIQTTLNEVRERCDLFLLIGDDGLLERYPLLAERTRPIRSEQRVLLIGDWSDASRKRFESSGRHAITIRASTDRLASGLLTADVLSADRKLLASNQLCVVCWSMNGPPIHRATRCG